MRNRLVATLVASVCAGVLLVACAESPTSTSLVSQLTPQGGPQYGRLLPVGCAVGADISACGKPGDGLPHKEELQICKVYPAGTVSTPAVQVQVDVKSDNTPEGPQTGLIFTVQPNSCLVVWLNGEDRGPFVDTVWVKELVPDGFTATSQVSTMRRVGPRSASSVYTTTVNPATSATEIKGYIGGYEVPGLTVTFTNTANPTPPPPGRGCTLTQGYWKNHEDAWPAPYSATAPWMKAGHLVNNTTWDGLMETAPKGGNSYLQLAHQWIAATLNAASGASLPANVQSTLTAAGAWLESNTPATGPVPFVKYDQATAWAGVLDAFNNGLSGTPHCD